MRGDWDLIYQHRLVICRSGRLEKRHVQFQRVAMNALDEHGSRLVGAWEIWIGPETGSGIWQLREHESLATWEQHRIRAKQDTTLRQGQAQDLHPTNDFVDTAILELEERSPTLPTDWPEFDSVRGQPRNFIEQRIIYLRPHRSPEHHALYFDKVAPALEREGGSLIAFFDTVIGPGTTNVGSHRSVEIRRFPDMTAWQRWREAQDQDPELVRLLKTDWLETVERVDSMLMRPMDYSRIR